MESFGGSTQALYGGEVHGKDLIYQLALGGADGKEID